MSEPPSYPLPPPHTLTQKWWPCRCIGCCMMMLGPPEFLGLPSAPGLQQGGRVQFSTMDLSTGLPAWP